jgi:hypothetical protein
MPKLKNESIGYLEMDEHSVLDQELIKELQTESDVEMIRAGEGVFFGVSPKMVPSNLMGKILSPDKLRIISNYWFVEVRLQEPLILHLRGSKTPQLMDCQCIIPSLRNLQATSMNHAFTLISRHYEKKRKSHSGNVFQRGYCNRDNQWLSFGDLRLQCQVQQTPKSAENGSKEHTKEIWHEQR